MDLSLASSTIAPPVNAGGAPGCADLLSPLPAELTGTQGWFTAYRRYPVFSRPWALGRMRVGCVVLLALLAGVLTVTQVLTPTSDQGHPVVAMAGVALVLFFAVGVPMLLGPWLAWQVRRRPWPRRRELAALLAVFAFTALATTVLFNHARPVLKNALSQWIEGREAGTTVLMLNLSVQRYVPGEGAMSLATGGPEAAVASAASPAWESWGRNVLWLLQITWVAGGMGLFGLQRERRALAEMTRRHELQAAQQARRDAELRLSVLQAQVEPHFLFNTLAGVRSAVTGDPARAVEIVDRLVDYLRASIPRLRSSASEAEATLGAQLDVARAYLALMRSRLLRLSFTIEAADDLLVARCPPLMLIGLVENAVKHGIEPKLGPGRIMVVACRQPAMQGPDRLEISVSDDGVGLREGAMGSGLGLVNVREQLLQLYGGAAELRLQSAPGGGARATLSLPLELPPS
ncbi:MAG TPA: histidine kinase [Burkholderiaceae bacterium]|nr:histidine kinase [Burkholderiaceae bacterium]